MDLIKNKIEFAIRNSSFGERSYQISMQYPEGIKGFNVFPAPTFSIKANTRMMQHIDPQLLMSIQMIEGFSVGMYSQIREEIKKIYE